MKQCVAVFLFGFFFCGMGIASESEEGLGAQNREEAQAQSVVRNKAFYKAGKLELGFSAGLLPYDLLFDHYLVGGRLTWHIRDHYSWEIIDYQHPFSSVTRFTTSLASDSDKAIADLQGLQLRNVIGTSFVMSPFYGKIRFWGATVAFLDIYLVAGLGAVNAQTLKFSYDGAGGYTQAGVGTAWSPSLNYGLGFKFFMGSVSLFFDLRNYMSYSTTYGRRGFHSNFSVSGGLSLFLPNFG